jgi:hypothetical protein
MSEDLYKKYNIKNTPIPESVNIHLKKSNNFFINHTKKEFIYIGPFLDIGFSGLCRYLMKFGWNVYDHNIEITDSLNHLPLIRTYTLIDISDESYDQLLVSKTGDLS